MHPAASAPPPPLIAAWRTTVRAVFPAALVGALAGTASAVFLHALDAVIVLRMAHPWLLALLPLAGVATAWVYRRHGGHAGRGNDLIISEIHQPGGGVPVRLAPLVLLGTLATHLCGGSAGREGTAVQMGGALASGVRRWLRLDASLQAGLLSAGVAGGFGAVFGTPLAGAVFALEVVTRGRVGYRWLAPCLIAALVGDQVCHALGGTHANYALLADLPRFTGSISVGDLLRAATLGLACALAARLFIFTTHAVARVPLGERGWWLRPVLGGLAIGALTLALGTDAYLNLNASSPNPAHPTLLTVFSPDGAGPWDWAWKIAFTALTVGAGYKGGEVTPLFFIGAALGHAVAPLLGLPVPIAAAIGFVAVFAGASKTPLACTLLAVELFGGSSVALFATACFVSYLASGRTSLYSSQRHADS